MSTTPSATRRLVAGALILALLFLVGCGDDDTAASDPSGFDALVDSPVDSNEPDSGEAVDDETAGGELPDACGLLDVAEVQALIGPATTENEGGYTLDGLEFNQCIWENEESGELVGVVLTTTTTRFESHLDNLPGEPVEGLGDQALTAGGVSLETTGATGGRTVSISDGDRTVVVALRLDGQTTIEAVRPLAESVLAQLG